MPAKQLVESVHKQAIESRKRRRVDGMNEAEETIKTARLGGWLGCVGHDRPLVGEEFVIADLTAGSLQLKLAAKLGGGFSLATLRACSDPVVASKLNGIERTLKDHRTDIECISSALTSTRRKN